MHVAQPEQGENIWFVRLGQQRIAQKNQQVETVFRDERSDLLVAAQRPTAKSVNGQIRRIRDTGACCTGGKQFVTSEQGFIGNCKIDDVSFFSVVRHQCDAHPFTPFSVAQNVPACRSHLLYPFRDTAGLRRPCG